MPGTREDLTDSEAACGGGKRGRYDKGRNQGTDRENDAEEKAAMCSGADFWHTEAVERLGIPAMMVSDGPHGLRKQDQEADNLGVNDSIQAVCFPAGCGTAASFNRELIREMGEALGEECQRKAWA